RVRDHDTHPEEASGSAGVAAQVVEFAGEAEENVIGPAAVDLKIVLCVTFLDKTILFEHAAAGDVAGEERGVDAVQVQLVENEGNDGGDGLAHQPLAGKILAHPISQIAELGGAAADIGEGD